MGNCALALKGVLGKIFRGLRELLDELEAKQVKDEELKVEGAATTSELIVAMNDDGMALAVISFVY